jgi:DNA polymerase-1
VGWVDTDNKWLRLPSEVVMRYNAYDCLATARVFKALRAELIHIGNHDFYENELWPSVPSTLAMQRRGLHIDRKKRNGIRADLRAQRKTCDDILHEHVGGPHLWGKGGDTSDIRVGRWLFTDGPAELAKGITVEGLGLRSGRRTEKTRRASVDRDALLVVLRGLRLKDAPHRPSIEALLHRSRANKLLEYLEVEPEDDGRIRPQVKLYGTKSMRLAYAEPPIHSWADELRYCITPREGHVFVAGDWSQLEARIASQLSGDQIDLATYRRGEDIHALTAQECFQLTVERWAAMNGALVKAHRLWAKNFRFGVLLYGGAPETVKARTFCPCTLFGCESKLPDTLNLTRNKMREVADRWFGHHNAVLSWRRRNLNQVRNHHYLVSPFGFKRYFLTPWGQSDLEREVYNWPIQHCAAVIALRAQRRLHKNYNAPIILQHHDALYLEVPEREADLWATRLRDTMQEPVPEIDDTSFPVETQVGTSWGDMREWKAMSYASDPTTATLSSSA